MGDSRKQALRVQFDGNLKLGSHGAKITSGAGPVPQWQSKGPNRLALARKVMMD